MPNKDSVTYNVVKKFVCSKTGRLSECEDIIHINDNFIAIIDGATSKIDRKWDGENGGKLCADTISKALDVLPIDCSAQQACDYMTEMVADIYRKFNVLDIVTKEPIHRIGAVFVVLSLARNELWSVGDCQFMLDNKLFSIQKEIDKILSSVRSLYLKMELFKGATINELQDNDTGREFILPLLQKQSYLQNNPYFGEYWYPIINGFPLPEEGIKITEIPHDIETIVMASDGYPVLSGSLQESEDILMNILKSDPLLIDKYKMTKGLNNGNISFDDRAFVKIEIQRI